MERRQLGEQFRVLEAAFVAPEPSSPNRILIFVLGALFGDHPQSLLDHVPHCRDLSMVALRAGPNEVTLKIPFDEHLVGDPGRGVVFGGVITTLFPGIADRLDPERTVALVVGPPVMYRFVLLALKSKGLTDESIYMSLERRMKCGVGKCGHCQINHSYVCQDGPVYHYPDIKSLQEAL